MEEQLKNLYDNLQDALMILEDEAPESEYTDRLIDLITQILSDIEEGGYPRNTIKTLKVALKVVIENARIGIDEYMQVKSLIEGDIKELLNESKMKESKNSFLDIVQRSTEALDGVISCYNSYSGYETNPDVVCIDIDTEDEDEAEDLAYEIRNLLKEKGINVDIIPMQNYELEEDDYDDLDEDYRDMYVLKVEKE